MTRRLPNWARRLDAADRDMLNRTARRMPFDPPLSAYPFGDRDLCLQVAAWQQLEAEVLESYGRWLAAMKSRCESAGREWTRTEFLRVAHLVDEDGDL